MNLAPTLFEQIKRIDVGGNLSIGQHADLQEWRHHGPVGSVLILGAIIPAEEADVAFAVFFVEKQGFQFGETSEFVFANCLAIPRSSSMLITSLEGVMNF